MSAADVPPNVPPGPPPPPTPITLAQRFQAAPAVWVIGVLNVAVYLWVEVQGGPGSRVMVDSGALVVPLLPGEPWRLLSSTFLHFSPMHLASNMFGLAIFGPAFERLVGTGRFVLLWLGAGLLGSVFVVALASGVVIAAGASGSVFGLLGALVVVGFRTRRTEAGRIQLRQALVLLGINLAFGLLEPQISLEAHAGGALAGALFLAAFRPHTTVRTV